MNRLKHLTCSLVIPTKNESASLGGILKVAKRHVDEIIVVDSSSPAERAKIVEIAEGAGARLVLEEPKGKGSAMVSGARVAKGDVIVFIDADGSHDPRDIPKLVAPIEKGIADVVFASRLIGGSEDITLERAVLGTFGTFLISKVYHLSLTDVMNGFKAIRRTELEKLGLSAPGFEIEVEFAIRCAKRKLRTYEVGSFEKKRPYGSSNLNVYKTAFSMAKIFLRELVI